MTELQDQLLRQLNAGQAVFTGKGDKLIARSLVKQGKVRVTPVMATAGGFPVRGIRVELL